MKLTQGGKHPPDAPAEVSVPLSQVTPEMDRRNAIIFFVSYLLIYFAAPVVYVDVVQAALCDRLGASATIANLPSAAYFFGSFAPIFFSWLIPHRLERAAVVWSNAIGSVLMAVVCATLFFPLANSIRIAAVVGQGLILGLSGSVSQVFMLQCVGRGTTMEGRVRAWKLAYGLGPIAAVAGSLTAQFILNRGLPFLPYPYDFAALYFIGVPCLGGVALLSRGYELVLVEDETGRAPFLRYLAGAVKSYLAVRPLVYLWFAYVLWYSTLMAMPNLSLYTRQALKRDPAELSGLMMALRFGFKSLGGFALGALNLRRGIGAPITTTILLVGGALVWAWFVPGYPYLLTFGMMGAGELGGAYIPQYALAVSPSELGPSNLSILTLATPVASISPVLHGVLTDLFGFKASFAFGIATALLALWLVTRLPADGKKLA
ncbi:MAG: MFS transporter [Acidimicrobiia bacterium]|nr:MFS transporter [Acidimicrobiia bacterium]